MKKTLLILLCIVILVVTFFLIKPLIGSKGSSQGEPMPQETVETQGKKDVETPATPHIEEEEAPSTEEEKPEEASSAEEEEPEEEPPELDIGEEYIIELEETQDTDYV